MTEVGTIPVENEHSNPSDSKMMIRPGISSGQEHSFPTPPYVASSLREEDEEEEDEEENNSSSKPVVEEDESMEVDRMNHRTDDDERHHPHHLGVNNGVDDDEENSMDSTTAGVTDEAMNYGKTTGTVTRTVRTILEKNLRRSEDDEVEEEGGITEEDEEGEFDDDDEAKLIIDSNELLHHQQQQQQLIESKLRNAAGTTTPTAVNKSAGGSSRPSSASPRGSPGVGHNNISQRETSILNMMMSGSKERLVNGHGQHQSHHHLSTNNSKIYQEHSDRHHHGYGNHHARHNHHHHHLSRNHPRDGTRSERKSSRSPLECDVKSEGIGNNLNANIGNALLNLASLGSLASIPNLLPSSTPSSTSSVAAAAAASESLNRTLGNLLSQSSTSSSLLPPPQAPHFPTMSGGMNTPLNLTSGSNSNSNSAGNILNNTLLTSHLAQLISQQNNNNLLTSNLLSSAALAAAAAGSSNAVGASSSNNNNGNGGTMPQLILASGQIVQGIQGAQLLIPTSGGLMSQTILTIPLNTPGMVGAGGGAGGGGQQQPSSSASSSPASHHQYPPSPQIPSHGSSSHHHQQQQHQSHHSHLHGARGHPISPPVAPTVPPATSPDFSDHHPSALPAPNLNLGSHSLSSQMGAHIPMDKFNEHSIGLHHAQPPQQHHSSRTVNGNGSGRREMNTITTNGGLSISTLVPQSKTSPGQSSHESDGFSDNDDSDQMVDGINLDEIKEFAKAFKLRRLSLGLTQTQVGQALSVTEGPAYSQSAICSALAWQLAQSQTHSNRTSIPQPFMFEKLDITPKSAQKIKPVLERWMKEAEDRYKNGHQNLNDFVGMEPSKKRKRRTSFTPQALEILNTHFDRNTHPSGAEITTLAHQLGYEREVIRIWFCNKRQALKNTVRMMSKGSASM